MTVEKGSSKGVDNFGYVNGKQIRMRYLGRNALGVTEFRLVEAK